MQSEELGEGKSRRAGREWLEAARSGAGGAQNSLVSSWIRVVLCTFKKWGLLVLTSSLAYLASTGVKNCCWCVPKDSNLIIEESSCLSPAVLNEQLEVGLGVGFKSLYYLQTKPMEREESLGERSKDFSLSH